MGEGVGDGRALDGARASHTRLGRVRPAPSDLEPAATKGSIATVATCSGTDEGALEIARRTGGIAEAMEGAAVLHAARALGASGIEVRVISNNTGERSAQVWDLSRAFDRLASFARALARE